MNIHAGFIVPPFRIIRVPLYLGVSAYILMDMAHCIVPMDSADHSGHIVGAMAGFLYIQFMWRKKRLLALGKMRNITSYKHACRCICMQHARMPASIYIAIHNNRPVYMCNILYMHACKT